MDKLIFIPIEIAYVSPRLQILLPLTVPVGSTVEYALKHSKVVEQYPEIEILPKGLGIFGKIVSKAHILNAGDRIEIYRALLLSPQASRKIRREAQVKNAKD